MDSSDSLCELGELCGNLLFLNASVGQLASSRNLPRSNADLATDANDPRACFGVSAAEGWPSIELTETDATGANSDRLEIASVSFGTDKFQFRC